jgi:maltoporin
MQSPVGLPGLKGLKVTLIAGLALLTTDALFAQSADQTDVNALKTQMTQMQRQYEQRIESMEAKMKSLESKSQSGSSILNTRVLTEADGKSMDGKAPTPMLDDSFLKSLTRNFVFTAYLRAGSGFNGSGGAQNFSFVTPENYGGRFRLGNENDTYMELTLQQNHILGDGPDVIDASARFTLQYFNGQKKSAGFNTQQSNTGAGIVEAFVEMKNVIKSSPEVTFWAGSRFYDRWNIDPDDYFWLNTSGTGAGVYNIPLGPGKLAIAYFDGVSDTNETDFSTTDVGPRIGDLVKHTLDLRWKDIDIGFGKLTAVLIGNFIKGSTFDTTVSDAAGNSYAGRFKVDDAWGIGGGLIWQYDFANKSYLRVAALFGWGATDFSSDPNTQENLNALAFGNQLLRANLGLSNNLSVNNGVTSVGNPVDHQNDWRAIVEYVWNPLPNFSMDTWAIWQNQSRGFRTTGFATAADQTLGINPISASSTRNTIGVGFRPVYWITDTFAIQGQAGFNYIDNDRGDSGVGALGRSGEMGIFTIAPTIKPKGGYFTRPELRIFATYAIWSDSLKGTSASGGSGSPYSGNANQGWVFGTQAEIWW